MVRVEDILQRSGLPTDPLAFLGGEPILGRRPIVRRPDHQHIGDLADLLTHPIRPVLRSYRDLDVDQRIDPMTAQELVKLHHLRLVRRIIVSI
jgi:hypothetical protein